MVRNGKSTPRHQRNICTNSRK
ncbi:hypothetical protein ACTMM0_18375, partial [Escherichia coli]